MSQLTPLADDVWVATQTLRFLGAEIGTRMTVLRLPDGALFLHSPIDPTPALRAEVEAIGRPAFLIAPNRMHHLFVGDWHRAYPDAELHLAPGLADKRPDLGSAHLLGDEAAAGWRGHIDQVAVQGFPMANEVAFFHRPSASLLLTDIAFHFTDDAPLLTRILIRLSGSLNRLAPTAVEKLLVRDRNAFRVGLERILAWPFERVIVTHGAVVESGGREQLRDGYRWLLKD